MNEPTNNELFVWMVVIMAVVVVFEILGTGHISSEIAALWADLESVAQSDQEPEIVVRGPSSQARGLFEAIRQVESGGWNGKLIGPDGCPTDIGPYQVTWAWWQDAFEGTPYASEGAYRRWAFDPDVCELGMERYWARYGAVTDEEKARCHHRGPNKDRWYDAAGDTYWAKVKGEMK